MNSWNTLNHWNSFSVLDFSVVPLHFFHGAKFGQLKQRFQFGQLKTNRMFGKMQCTSRIVHAASPEQSVRYETLSDLALQILMNKDDICQQVMKAAMLWLLLYETVALGVWWHCAQLTGKLASLNRAWQSNKGTFRASGMAGNEPMPSESNDWTPLSP